MFVMPGNGLASIQVVFLQSLLKHSHLFIEVYEKFHDIANKLLCLSVVVTPEAPIQSAMRVLIMTFKIYCRRVTMYSIYGQLSCPIWSKSIKSSKVLY